MTGIVIIIWCCNNRFRIVKKILPSNDTTTQKKCDVNP